MTEFSYWWTTSGTPSGDQVASYTQAQLATIAALIAGGSAFEGVIAGYLNEFAISFPGSETARLASGGAVVDGKPYESDADVDINVPAASGAGNTRIDRIVLRADWSAFTVRLVRIAGTDAATPSAPAITQSPGTTYDVTLYQVLVDTAGTVTEQLDERVWAAPEVDDATVEVDQDTGALQVKDGGVDTAQLVNAAVTLAKIADDAVDDTKVGDRVPQFYRRQGGDASDWSVAGTTNHTPGAERIQSGVRGSGTVTAGSANQRSVTFPEAFANAPIVVGLVAEVAPGSVPQEQFDIEVSGVTSNGMTINIRNNGSADGSCDVHWTVVGPE